MPNDRNAGRKPKYGKVKLRLLQRKVPYSKYTEIATKVDELLKQYQLPIEQQQAILNQSNPDMENIANRKLNDKISEL